MHNPAVKDGALGSFDTGPLSWVLGEIREALQSSRAALFEAVEKGADAGTTLFNHANAYLQQAHGALQIVDVHGADLITEAAEEVLRAMTEGRVPATAENASLVGKIYQALIEYLEDLLAGAPQQPILLFPYYREVKEALGAQRIHAAEFLFPNFTNRLQTLSVSADESVTRASEDTDYSALRPRFERALLPVLKGTAIPAGMEEVGALRELIAEIEQTQKDNRLQDFWWVMHGFAEMAYEGQFTSDLYVKLVFARINLQIRQLAARSDFMSERLLKEALFLIACAESPTPLMREIRAVYQIDGQIPADYEKKRYGLIDPEVLGAARQGIEQAKKSWIEASTGNTQSIEELVQNINQLAEASSALHLPALAQVFSAIGSVLADGDAVMTNEQLALEMASSLLFAENALEHIRLLPADFSQKAEVLANRLRLLHSGQALADAETANMVPETQQRTVMKLASEMGANLRQVERILSDYFDDFSQSGILTEVKPILQQIEGGLALVEQEDARQAVEQIIKVVEGMRETSNDEPFSQKILEDIAHNVSALGFFLEMLAQHPDSVKGRFSFDPDAGIFHAHLVEAGDVRGTSFLSGNDAEAARNELEAVLGEGEGVSNARPAPLATALVAEPASAEFEEDDLLEVFISEAEEVLDYIKSTVSALQGASEDQEQFPTLRRSFHTLKGSSRMVGLTDFSQASASIEQVMNLWLSEMRDGTSDLYALLGKAAEELGLWVSDLKANGESRRTPQALTDAAERVKKGEEFLFVESVESVPAEFAEALADETAESGVERLELPQEMPEPVILDFAGEWDEESFDSIVLEDMAEPAEPGRAIDNIGLLQEQSNVIEFPLPAPAVMPDDGIKRIGNLQISMPLFNIYLAEADELIRYLSQDFAEWQHEPERPVIEKAIHVAHSLAGCSATVGFQSLQDVAHALEMFLLILEEQRTKMTNGEFSVLQQCVDSLKGMLAQVARDEMPSPDTELLQRLHEMQQRLSAHDAAEGESLRPKYVEEAVAENAPVFVQNEEPAPSVFEGQLGTVEAEAGLAHKDVLDPDLLPVFLEEGRDLLPQIGQALRAWQKSPSDFSIAPRILRHLHTTKGSARMAGAMGLGQHIHLLESRVENVLRTKSATPQVLEDLLSRHDHSMQLFALLEDPNEGTQVSPDAGDDFTAGGDAIQPGATGGTAAAVPRVRVRADILDRLVNQAGEVSIARSKIENEVETLRQSMFELTDNLARLRQQLREVEIQAETQIASRLAQTGDREFDPLEFDRFSRLQELTRMMTESVDDISSIQEGLVRTVDGATLDLENQSRLTRVLQEDLMQVRMIPFSSIAERLYQVTRQTAKETDKRVNLDIHGATVEVDRGVLEKMVGPLEHLLRNAIVHGIEDREQRRKVDKDETGELVVEVRQEGNEVVIQFSDDGRGLNLERIRARAEAVGMISPDREMTEAQLKELIFQTGFSTASEITELAGRGVGLDVVRAEVAALGGRVAIGESTGRGTRFTINLPLTMAVTSVVLLSTGGNTYAVPSILVEQVQHFRRDALANAHSSGSVTWLNESVPIFFLSALLGDTRATPMVQQYTPVVIIRSGTERVALHVDEILGNKEVVVKNIGPQLARMAGIAGATVLGSGDIVLILNPVPLAQRGMEGRLLPYSSILPAFGSETAKAEEIAFDQAQPGMTIGAGSPQEQLGVRKKNIVMVVDDSLTVRRVTQRFLTREGYQVVLAKDGIDALEQLQNVTPDVMLVDIEMPRMDGFDLTRNVRNDSRLRGIPIIMITSRSAAKHRNYAMDLGVNEYYGKPFQEEELLKSIDTFVHKEMTTS